MVQDPRPLEVRGCRDNNINMYLKMVCLWSGEEE